MKSEKTKENILLQTIGLIQETGGDIESITIRGIAARAGVGVGLINHYFGSKEHLVEACVQTIISEVIRSFRPELTDDTSPAALTKCVARQVMDVLMDNRQLSRLSILGDMNRPQSLDNTMKTVAGFAGHLSGGEPNGKHKLEAFMITSVLQGAFLRKDLLGESFGIDFYDKRQRDEFIDGLVERIAGT